MRDSRSNSELLEQAMAQLQAILGRDWSVQEVDGSSEALGGNDQLADAVWRVAHRHSRTRPAVFVVEARARADTSSAAQVIRAVLDTMVESDDEAQVLVVAPWLSPSVRELLDATNVGYIDLTGNVSVRSNRPAIVLKTQGATKNPDAAPRGQRGLSGARAGRLVRELVDVRPPRLAAELVQRTGISQPYVSRLLDVMSDQALIRREGRMITEVRWVELLRERASTYQLMRSGHHVAAVARRGRGRLIEDLAERGAERAGHRVVATGTFVAEQVAPVSVGGPLMLYVPPGPRVIDEVAKDLALLRTDQSVNTSLNGADVVLMQASNDTYSHRTQLLQGIECVGHSQLVLDCLTGPGRMPAEGEAVLEWMIAHQDDGRWRGPSPLD